MFTCINFAVCVFRDITEKNDISKVKVGVLDLFIVDMRDLSSSTHNASQHHKAPAEPDDTAQLPQSRLPSCELLRFQTPLEPHHTSNDDKNFSKFSLC
jgi:hypothetical protein